MTYRNTAGSRIFDTFNYLILLLVGLITLAPFYYIFVASMSPLKQVLYGSFILWPQKFTFSAYQAILSNQTFINSLLFTVFITVFGTLVNLTFTVFTAYGISKKRLKGRRVILFLVLFSMLFNGGLIPTFLVVKGFGMLDTVWALLLPGAISAFNLIILKNFFLSIPESIEESARIDGSSNIGVLFRIVLPLSLPALATFTLFYGVANWNQFFAPIIYENNSHYWTIQVLLRQMIILGNTQGYGTLQQADSSDLNILPETLKYAAIIVATVPILFVYPFLQKYFSQGVLMGSVKE